MSVPDYTHDTPTFTGMLLDRAMDERADPEMIARLLGDPRAGVLAASEQGVLVGNGDEWAVLGEPPEQVELTIEKRGPEGVRGSRGGEVVDVPPIAVEVVNGLGAGDAFGGALCHELLAGADEMPSADEVEELLCVG